MSSITVPPPDAHFNRGERSEIEIHYNGNILLSVNRTYLIEEKHGDPNLNKVLIHELAVPAIQKIKNDIKNHEKPWTDENDKNAKKRSLLDIMDRHFKSYTNSIRETNSIMGDEKKSHWKVYIDRWQDPLPLRHLGGKRNSNETGVDAAIREVFEETGFNINKQDIRTRATTFDPSYSDIKYLGITHYPNKAYIELNEYQINNLMRGFHIKYSTNQSELQTLILVNKNDFSDIKEIHGYGSDLSDPNVPLYHTIIRNTLRDINIATTSADITGKWKQGSISKDEKINKRNTARKTVQKKYLKYKIKYFKLKQLLDNNKL